MGIRIFLNVAADVVWGSLCNLQLIVNHSNFPKIKYSGQMRLLFYSIESTVNFDIKQYPVLDNFVEDYMIFFKEIVDQYGVVPLGILGVCIVILFFAFLRILFHRFEKFRLKLQAI